MNVLAQSGEIVNTAHVAGALENGAIVWDVRDAGSYAAGHIPGAVNVGAITTVLRDPVTENWLPTAQVEAVLGKAGIDLAKREVIAYGGTGDPSAYFGLLTVRYFGGRSGKVYHGGIDAWRAAGKPVATEPARLAPVTLKLETRKGVVIWTDEVVQKVVDAKAGTVQIVDVRTPPEYSGQAVSAIRGGHIPGAVNIPVGGNFVRPPTPAEIASGECASPDGMALKPTADLKKLYANLDRNKETIVHCQSGGRASVTVTLLRDLGFKDVKLYKPGWLGYAGALAAPAADETFVNIGALNQHIRSLEARIAELEKQVARVKKPN
jgi:thiosulfate/3-mercaptopyruvate sulfurtransferase